jgi:hypothetical protein
MMKKTVALFAVLAVLGCSNPSGGSEGPVPEPPSSWDEFRADGFDGGTGSAEDPYVIRTEAQLAYLAWTVNNDEADYAGNYFTLESDLDFDDHEWTAIGTDDHRFKGTFDGDHHVISRLRIDKSGTYYQGLFGVLDGAEISNLGLEDVVIQGGRYIGGIAGCVFSSGIENSYSTGMVSGIYRIGGIVGRIYNTSSISGSYSTEAVSGSQQVGGIAGLVYNSSIKNCVALNPSVTAASNDAGRVAGLISSSNTFTGNVAWDEMGTGGGTNFTAGNDYNGTLKAKTAFHNATGFPFDVNDDPWTTLQAICPYSTAWRGRTIRCLCILNSKAQERQTPNFA